MIQLLLFITLIFGLPTVAHALEISEIAYDTPGSDTDHEWIELYNETDQVIDLAKRYFFDGSYHGLIPPPEKGGQGDLQLEPYSHLIIADDATTFLADHSGFVGTVIDTVMSLSNSESEEGILIAITNEQKEHVVEGRYRPTANSRLGYTLEWHNGQWQESILVGGSPGQPPEVQSRSYSKSVHLSEILANPAGPDTGKEWVELINLSDQPVDLSGWYLTDRPTESGKVNRHTFPVETIIAPNSYLQILLKGSFLNNSNESIALYWPTGEVVESIDLPSGPVDDSSYARFDDAWQLTGQLTPAAANIAVSLSPSPAGRASASQTHQTSSQDRQASTPRSGEKSSRTVTPSQSRAPTVSPVVQAKQALQVALSPQALSPLQGSDTSQVTEAPKHLRQVAGLAVNRGGQINPRTLALLLVVVMSLGSLAYWQRARVLSIIVKIKEHFRPSLIA